MLERITARSGCAVSRLMCALLLLLLLQGVDWSQQFTCFRALSPPLLEPLDLVECDLGITSCHEYVYAYSTSPYLMYAAGCGAKVPDFVQSARSTLNVRRVKNCHDVDACNEELRQELLATSRICRYAVASRRLENLTVACLPYESRCYFEKSASAVPFYYAGCGACPAHTLTCITCSLNLCNSSDPAAADAPSGQQTTSVPLMAAASAPTTQAPASSAMLAALLGAALVSCLARRLPLIYF